MRRVTRLTGVGLLFALSAAACAGPPNKEMDQAEGAIEAARAAGAAQYAATELAAAQEALEGALEAVDGRDYRLALSQALESRDQAQDAARVAADTRERLRGELERALAELLLLVTETRQRLGEAAGTAAQRAAHDARLGALSDMDSRLQEAGAMLDSGDYTGARAILDDVRARLDTFVEIATPPR